MRQGPLGLGELLILCQTGCGAPAVATWDCGCYGSTPRPRCEEHSLKDKMCLAEEDFYVVEVIGIEGVPPRRTE